MRKRGLRFSKMGKQSLVGNWKFLRQDAGLTYHRNKIRISNPAGEHVHVQVVFDSCTRRTTEIESEIVTIGMILPPQRALAEPAHFDHLMQLIGGCVFEKGNVPVCDAHHVACRVREKIQKDKRVLAAKEHKILDVPALRQDAAKNARYRLIGATDVLEAPWSPESVH